MNSKEPHRFSSRIIPMFLVGLALLGCVTLMPRSGVLAQATEDSAAADEDLARLTDRLKQTLTGRVDVYLDNSQLDVAAPGLANVRFVEVVGVSGHYLLRFSDGKGGQWLVDFERVLTLRAYES